MLSALRAHRRVVTVLLAAGCAAMLCYALYVEHYQGLEPCPLCMFQRYGVVLLGCVLLLAAAVPSAWRVAGNISAVLIGLAGAAAAGVAIRHLYIQSLPEGSVPACGATLDYMMEIFGPLEVLTKVLTASGECGKVDWTFLGLSMPAWVLIPVVLIAAAGMFANWRTARR